MKFVTTHNGSYPRVGDKPGQQELRKTVDLWEKGKKSQSDLEKVLDQVTLEAIAEQKEAGIDLPTDGQIRWYDLISHPMRRVAGVKINGLLRFFDTNTYFRQPVIEGKVSWKEPLLAPEYVFAVKQSGTKLKAVITGPYTLATLSIYNGKREELTMELAEVIAREVEEFSKAGAEVIQMDEPWILKNPADAKLLSQALKVCASRKGKAKLALRTYFGDAAPLYDAMQEWPVDILGLDLTYSPTLPDKIMSSGSRKELSLGLVDGRNTKLEKPEDLARNVEKWVGKLNTATTYLGPSCGLEYLPRTRAFEKLKVVGAVKKLLR